MSREVVINLKTLNEVINYLVNRPYKEVADLIDGIKSSIKELPNETKEKAEETAQDS